MDFKMDVLCMDRTHCWSAWHWDSDPIDDQQRFNLFIALSGRGGARVDGSVWSLAMGDCFLFDFRTTIRTWHDPRQPLVVDWAVFRTGSQAVADALRMRHPFAMRTHQLSLLTGLFGKALLAARHRQDVERNVFLKSMLFALRMEHDAANVHGATRERAECIEAVVQWIERDPGHAFSVPEMAQRCHVSPRHFSRIFKQATGAAPRDYVLHVRVDKARQYLRHSSLSVGEIAQVLGFKDLFHFSRLFKTKTGQSPTAYRDDAG